MEERTFKIDENQEHQRLDKAVALFLDVSRKRVKDLLDDNHIFVNGKSAKASYTTMLNDRITIEIPEDENTEVLPENIPLDIVYEDSDLIVINKPKGMVVHPAPGHYSGTLVNALLYHCKDLSGINGVNRPGIVHRIDKDTSGLLVVCKNDKAHKAISEQLANKTCHRQYVCIVHHPFSHEYGTIHAPIGRSEKDRKKMEVTSKNSKDAITHFTVLKNFREYAYVQCQLETGRTHQIRVQFASRGYPIVGDHKYGSKDKQTNPMLYCYQLTFKHHDQVMTFTNYPPFSQHF